MVEQLQEKIDAFNTQIEESELTIKLLQEQIVAVKAAKKKVEKLMVQAKEVFGDE
jgi:hypothetical protein